MMRLFNRSFFKFIFGFAGMVLFGLLGIVAVGYMSENDTSGTAADEELVKILPE